jgi:hypothetical protein
MEAFIQKKYRLALKINSLHKFLALIFAIGYGLFIVFSLRLQYESGSGDVGSYLHFFDQIKQGGDAPALSLKQDGAFRLGVLFLRNFFDVQTLTILSAFGFITSTIVTYIFLTNIKSEKHLIYLLPLLAMVFLSPVVQVLFSSNIRSGIAFTILMIALTYLKGLPRLALFGLSSIIHFSMIPFIGFYILFHLINRLSFDGIRLNNTFTFLVLLCASIFFAIVGGIVHVDAIVNSSFAYNLLMLYISFLMIFTGRKSIHNIYGFISVGMIFIYFSGILIDVSYSRYFGNALLLYFLFLIQQGEERKIEIFTVGIIPFFILTLSYMFSNAS